MLLYYKGCVLIYSWGKINNFSLVNKHTWHFIKLNRRDD